MLRQYVAELKEWIHEEEAKRLADMGACLRAEGREE
jgi:hypothetical protein